MESSKRYVSPSFSFYSIRNWNFAILRNRGSSSFFLFLFFFDLDDPRWMKRGSLNFERSIEQRE